MRPLQHKCPTLRGDKDDKERRQTITCQKFHPNTGYLFLLMYVYITQGAQTGASSASPHEPRPSSPRG